ncbi:MAG: SDR family oxidoreductase [Dorea sp.]|jgi:3-oxoacyl-[acyl-carrier protein] reductase|nr:SDR family oxidoreductase [Dorea sp.]
MKKLLENKNIIVTGTRRGIGKKLLEILAANGANVWAHARIETNDFTDECKRLSEKYKIQVWPVCFEMTDYEAMRGAIKKIRNYKLPVDGLVNNAGITYNALFQMSDMNVVRKQMEVNFFSVYQFTQYIVKLMIRTKKGSIVNISSTAGLDGNSGKSAYGASKAALIAMTKSVAAELGNQGIRANCIAPGITETEMLSTMPDYIVEAVKNDVDLKRVGKPEDIADTAVFLLSDLSSYITGQVIRVDGGM